MDDITKKQAASLKSMAALLGHNKIDLFCERIADHFKRGNVKGVKEGIALLQTALDISNSEDEDNEDEPQIADVTDKADNGIEEALGVDNLKPTKNKDAIRIVLALRLRKNDKGKFKIADNILASSVGHLDADDDTVTMRQILSAFCASGIKTFLKELAKGDESTVDLFNSLKEEIDSAK